MKLNHLNLSVTDVQATKAFLETYFGLVSEGAAPDRKNFAILRDDNGMVLTLMQGAPATVTYPRTFHIGFIQESEDAVNALHARLTADGYEAAPPERSHAWTFYVQAPGGILVEVLG
jgi:catechol 2,3-dioxygenase-like lactoylglutathione lyase family enzyme